MSLHQTYDIDTRQIKQIGNYTIGAEVGSGAFGKVVLGKHILTNETVAIKILDKMILSQTPEDYELVRQEISILKIVKHKYIVQLYEILQTVQHIFIVMEYCEGKDLMDYILSKNHLTEYESLKYFQQLINALFYLHSQNISHRDVKIDNMLLDKNKNLKLVDFGLSTKYSDDNLLDQPCGTVVYAAPEVLDGNEYHGMLADVWSSGIVLFGMTSGYLPFCDQDDEVNKKHVLEGKIEIPEFFSPMLKDLLMHMLDINPLNRYTLQDIREHPWFNMIDTNLIPGIIIGYNMIPVDENILNLCVAYNADKKKVEYSVKNNIYDEGSALYYLLVKKITKKGFESVSDLSSDAFIDFILDDYNLINNNNNLDNKNNKDLSNEKIQKTTSLSSNKHEIICTNSSRVTAGDLGAAPGLNSGLENNSNSAKKSKKKEFGMMKNINKKVIADRKNNKGKNTSVNKKQNMNLSSVKNKLNNNDKIKKNYNKKNSENNKANTNITTPVNKDNRENKISKIKPIKKEPKNLVLFNNKDKNNLNKINKKRLNNSAEYRRANTNKITENDNTTKNPNNNIKSKENINNNFVNNQNLTKNNEKQTELILEHHNESENNNNFIQKQESTDIEKNTINNLNNFENIENKDTNNNNDNPTSLLNKTLNLENLQNKLMEEDLVIKNERVGTEKNTKNAKTPIKKIINKKEKNKKGTIFSAYQEPSTKFKKKYGHSKEKLNDPIQHKIPKTKINSVYNNKIQQKTKDSNKNLNISKIKNTKPNKVHRVSKSIEFGNHNNSNSVYDISFVETREKKPYKNLLNSYESNMEKKKKHKKVISCIKYNYYSGNDCILEEPHGKKNYKKILNQTTRNYNKKQTDSIIHIKSISQPSLDVNNTNNNNNLRNSKSNKNNSTFHYGYRNNMTTFNIKNPNYHHYKLKKKSPKERVEISNRLYTTNNNVINHKNKGNTTLNYALNTSKFMDKDNNYNGKVSAKNIKNRKISPFKKNKNSLSNKKNNITSIKNLNDKLTDNEFHSKNKKNKLYEHNKNKNSLCDISVVSPTNNKLNMSSNLNNSNHRLFKYGPSNSVPKKIIQYNNINTKNKKNRIRLDFAPHLYENSVNEKIDSNRKNKNRLNNSVIIGKTDSKKFTELKKYINRGQNQRKNIRTKNLESSVGTYRKKNTSNIIRDLSYSPKQIYLNEKTRQSRIPWKIQKKGIDEKIPNDQIYSKYIKKLNNPLKVNGNTKIINKNRIKKHKPMNIRNRNLKTVKDEESNLITNNKVYNNHINNKSQIKVEKKNLNQTEFNDYNDNPLNQRNKEKNILNKTNLYTKENNNIEKENNNEFNTARRYKHKAKCFSNGSLPPKERQLKITDENLYLNTNINNNNSVKKRFNNETNIIKSVNELGLRNGTKNKKNTNNLAKINNKINNGFSLGSSISVSSASSRKENNLLRLSMDVIDLACIVNGENISDCCLNIVNKLKKHGCSIFYLKPNKIKVTKNNNCCEIEMAKFIMDDDTINEEEKANKNIFYYKLNNKKSTLAGNKCFFTKFLLGP